MNWHRLIQAISFFDRRFLDFLVTRPDLFRIVMDLNPVFPRTVTRFVLVWPLPFLNSECVCTELYKNILLYYRGFNFSH
jgi:hypothetical protein